MENARMNSLFPALYSLGFVVAAALSILMLATDTNLQTNFGSTPKYFIHWYAVLGMAIADFIGIGLLLGLRSRLAIKLGVIGSALLSVAMVAVVFTYMQVGFSSAGAFANYLFGVTYSGGDIRYLYDALLGVDIATAVGGATLLAVTVESHAPSDAPGKNGTPSS
jgi:hypothetical protein